jgi:hypothetical protein
MQITVQAGRHERKECPVRVTFSEGLGDGEWALEGAGGNALPLQRLSDTVFAFVVPFLAAGEARTFNVVSVGGGVSERVSLTQGEESLEIALDDALVTRYHFARVKARPFFYPLLAPNGVPLTRAYPLIPDAPDEMRDHPHHRSLWIAFGEVNEADNWSEEPGHGHTEHLRFEMRESGRVFGRFQTVSHWTTANHEPLLSQDLTVTVWATSGDCRLLDFDIQMRALDHDVVFGDTKEGGILSVRVATPLDVDRTGTITNSYGGIDEGETWGKAAHWCDYSGVNDGERVGVAILDHPFSFRYPTHWHVRNYGLMTANPFGYSYYTQGAKSGRHVLSSGETLSFHYRLVLHNGDSETADIAAKYLDFVAPARATLE